MKKIILLAWSLILLFTYRGGPSPSWADEGHAARAFPDGYMEATQGVGLVLFFTGDLKGNYEPCG